MTHRILSLLLKKGIETIYKQFIWHVTPCNSCDLDCAANEQTWQTNPTDTSTFYHFILLQTYDRSINSRVIDAFTLLCVFHRVRTRFLSVALRLVLSHIKVSINLHTNDNLIEK